MTAAALTSPIVDPCRSNEITANPTRPTWDIAAATTQCGVLESDFGWLQQPIGSGTSQWMLLSSARYGLTPRFDLRWGITNRIVQRGGNTRAVKGVGDDWLSARYRFFEQGRWTPAMALDYGIKIPAANPAKGLGSGFVDHEFLFIASRDLGKNHFDFNTVGTLAGGPRGHDGAAQFGLVLTRPVARKLAVVLESYGGSQPATTNRYGAALIGAEWNLRPSLVMDTAYSRAFTAGAPRQQFLVGFTYAMRPGFSPLSKGAAMARLLGR